MLSEMCKFILKELCLHYVLRQTLGKPLEMPKTAFSDNAIWQRKIFERLSHLKLGLKIMSIQVTPPQIAMMKMFRQFAVWSTKPNVPLWSSLAG
jgi:hypothetical protein